MPGEQGSSPSAVKAHDSRSPSNSQARPIDSCECAVKAVDLLFLLLEFFDFRFRVFWIGYFTNEANAFTFAASAECKLVVTWQQSARFGGDLTCLEGCGT